MGRGATSVRDGAGTEHLLWVEGLTLAGARRKLEETAPVGANTRVIDELIGRNARERLTDVKRGLRSILDLLAGRGRDEFHLAPPVAVSRRPRQAEAARAKHSRGKAPASRNGSRTVTARSRR